jgi:hypothetical protein
LIPRPVEEEALVSSPRSDTSIFEYNEDHIPGLAHEDYEFLYYMIICKLQELYRDLQIRYACGFIEMDHVLHHRSHTGTCKTEQVFTVQDMRNFVLAAWHLYHEQTFLYFLSNAIKNRKLSILSGLSIPELCNASGESPQPYSSNDNETPATTKTL